MVKDNCTEHLPHASKLNKEVSDTIASIVKEGLFPYRACESIGIAEPTYYQWRDYGLKLQGTGYSIDGNNLIDPDGVLVPEGKFKTAAWEYLYLLRSIKRAEGEFLRDAIGKVRQYAGETKQWAGEMTLLSRRFREYADQAPSTGDTVSHALDRLRELVAEIKRPELPHITVEARQIEKEAVTPDVQE